jgi:hypothetical protein
VNDNEDLYKPVQCEYQGFTSIIIRGSLVRAQLDPPSPSYFKASEGEGGFLRQALMPALRKFRIHNRIYQILELSAGALLIIFLNSDISRNGFHAGSNWSILTDNGPG